MLRILIRKLSLGKKVCNITPTSPRDQWVDHIICWIGPYEDSDFMYDVNKNNFPKGVFNILLVSNIQLCKQSIARSFIWLNHPRYFHVTLKWRHHECDYVLSHQPHDCLLNRLFKVQIKENIKTPRHWPLCGEFTGDRWIPSTEGSNAENVSISWRHHD